MSIFLNDWNSIVRINGYKSIEYKRKIPNSPKSRIGSKYSRKFFEYHIICFYYLLNRMAKC